MSTTKPQSILIVGAGTWGNSTALHLMRRGYTDVTLVDPYPVPSPISAGNDVNKIVEQGIFSEGDDEAFVAKTVLDAANKGWTSDPVFSPYYHDTGYIVAASSPDGLKQLFDRERPDINPDFVRLEDAESFRKTMPDGILTGDFPGWKGLYKSTGAGWVHARKALVSCATEAKKLGARYVVAEVTALIFEDGDVKGVKTKVGREMRAHTTILCAGANCDQLLDFKGQLRATAWTLAHIQMTPDETKLFKNLPVLFHIEKGFFMEPDEDKQQLKMCDEHPGYCNWIKKSDGSRVSVPLAKHQIPIEAERRCREFLRETMPQLADRPFCFARLCWCADTPNRAFLIDRHPEYPSLVLGCGGSGHGYKDIPSIGAFIADALDGNLEPRLKKSFRWRPETAVNRNWEDTQGRFGGPNTIMDLQDVTSWTDIPAEASTAKL
ncbi:oxygen oxidoreductase [Exophiala viscosa]|uniref:Oxygen oxidoreductase n=1 Tax=Exophiala viscosa TaxID=2486360 RepID=A0AAN6E5P2_9EURO|nr:oxygen oxidoreductase [Exophiala viscosa]